jgi:hypothetical protein
MPVSARSSVLTHYWDAFLTVSTHYLGAFGVLAVLWLLCALLIVWLLVPRTAFPTASKRP